MKRNNYLSVILLASMIFSPVLLPAQGLDDPGGDPAAVPIDGGLSLLLAAGVAYGVKKGYSNHKKKRNADNEKNVVDK
jgi:hypothetical protein